MTKADTSNAKILVIATAMLMAIAGVFWSEIEAFPENGIHVTGTVVRVEPAVVRAKATHVRIVRYQYGGETFEIKDPVPNRFGYATGTALRVTLDPEQPRKAVLSNTASFYAIRIIAGVLTLLSLVSAVLLVRTILSVFRSGRTPN